MISKAISAISSFIRPNMKITNKDESEEDDIDSEIATGRMQFFETVHLLLTKRKNLLELDNLCIDERNFAVAGLEQCNRIKKLGLTFDDSIESAWIDQFIEDAPTVITLCEDSHKEFDKTMLEASRGIDKFIKCLGKVCDLKAESIENMKKTFQQMHNIRNKLSKYDNCIYDTKSSSDEYRPVINIDDPTNGKVLQSLDSDDDEFYVYRYDQSNSGLAHLDKKQSSSVREHYSSSNNPSKKTSPPKRDMKPFVKKLLSNSKNINDKSALDNDLNDENKNFENILSNNTSNYGKIESRNYDDNDDVNAENFNEQPSAKKRKRIYNSLNKNDSDTDSSNNYQNGIQNKKIKIDSNSSVLPHQKDRILHNNRNSKQTYDGSKSDISKADHDNEWLTNQRKQNLPEYSFSEVSTAPKITNTYGKSQFKRDSNGSYILNHTEKFDVNLSSQEDDDDDKVKDAKYDSDDDNSDYGSRKNHQVVDKLIHSHSHTFPLSSSSLSHHHNGNALPTASKNSHQRKSSYSSSSRDNNRNTNNNSSSDVQSPRRNSQNGSKIILNFFNDDSENESHDIHITKEVSKNQREYSSHHSKENINCNNVNTNNFKRSSSSSSESLMAPVYCDLPETEQNHSQSSSNSKDASFQSDLLVQSKDIQLQNKDSDKNQSENGNLSSTINTKTIIDLSED